MNSPSPYPFYATYISATPSEQHSPKRVPSHQSMLRVVNPQPDQEEKSHSLKSFPIPHVRKKNRTQLEQQAIRIHYLTAELEQAIWDFKAIAAQTHLQQEPLRKKKQPKICEYRTLQLPQIIKKPDETFLLTSRPLKLFQAEKKASRLAQTLRPKKRK